MSLIFDEEFEAAGYDETWSSGESIGTGCTLEEDADVADVGSPSGWGSQCLKMVSASTGYEARVFDTGGGSQAITYHSFEFVVTAESLSDDHRGGLLRLWDGDGNDALWCAFHQYSTDLKVYIQSFHDGSTNVYRSLTNLSLNTVYQFEFKWDATANAWAWRLDGVDQPNNVDNSDPVESEGTLSDTHVTEISRWSLGQQSYDDDVAWTCYFDNYKVDDTTWIGQTANGNPWHAYAQQ